MNIYFLIISKIENVFKNFSHFRKIHGIIQGTCQRAGLKNGEINHFHGIPHDVPYPCALNHNQRRERDSQIHFTIIYLLLFLQHILIIMTFFFTITLFQIASTPSLIRRITYLNPSEGDTITLFQIASTPSLIRRKTYLNL